MNVNLEALRIDVDQTLDRYQPFAILIKLQ